jgi:hypothetical protein
MVVAYGSFLVANTYTITQADQAFVKTAGGSAITVASGTTVPLTIQNNGTGNSFVVNDVASDTTPFVIDASGNVGIGTAANESGNLLHVAGNTFVSPTSGTIGKVTVDNVDNRLILGSYYQAGVGQNSFISSTNNAETGNVALLFNTGTTERMRISDTGNVGIGTTSPSSQLTVGANPPAAGAIAAVGANGGISLALSDNVNNSLYVRHVGGGSGAILGTDAGGAMRFATGGNTATEERMRISSTGDVGIGTTSPAAKLDVNGSIKSDNLSGRNRIINGAFDIWQRGTSFTTNSAYGPDRWFLTGTTSSMAITQVTSSLPSGFQYAIKLQRNSGVTATDIYSISQPFETSASIPLQGQKIIFSFWAKTGANFSAASGAGLIRLYSGTGTNQSAASQFGGWTGYSEWQSTGVFFPTTTWTRFFVTGTVPSSATQIGMRVGWQATGTAGADDSLQITGIQLEAGNVATPFTTATGTIQGELAACCYYYERLVSDATYTLMGSGWYTSTSRLFVSLPYQRKRVVPSIAFSNMAGWYGPGNVGAATIATSYIGKTSAGLDLSISGASTTVGYGGALGSNNNAAGYIELNSEL